MTMSLTQRLIGATSVVLGLSLLFAGLVLEKAFSISLDNIAREKLRAHTYDLLALADSDLGGIDLPVQLPDKRFNSNGGSLLGFVTDLNKREVWRSVSANNLRFSLPQPEVGKWLFGQAEDEVGRIYYVSSLSSLWPDASGEKRVFVFTVMEDRELYSRHYSEFRLYVGAALTILGVILILLQTVILRWGLIPLRGLVSDVVSMNQGVKTSLEGEYSKELYPLASNLNVLIDNERRQRLMFRERMEDLSHSLKTPLSVLHSIETDVDDSGAPLSRAQILETLKRHVGRMSDIVDHQLQRAVATNQKISFLAVPLLQEISLIVRALNKVYAEKPLCVEVDVDDALSIYADENDIAEVLGNLIDNAYKYSRQRIKISAVSTTSNLGEKKVGICVEDDGLGIPDAKQADVLQRGTRLDTRQEGQGFGLSIALEILSTYDGRISLLDSEMGGAKVYFEFPAK